MRPEIVFDLPKTQSEGRRLNSPYYFTGKPCKNGHIEIRRSVNGVCVACYKDWQRKNLVSLNARRVFKRQASPEWREKINLQARQHRKNNLSKYTQYYRLRKAKRKQAKPFWVCDKTLNEIYEQAQYVSRLTNVLHEVDHIVPLRNTKVCGLHVPWNLRIITAEENLRKSNLFQGSR